MISTKFTIPETLKNKTLNSADKTLLTMVVIFTLMLWGYFSVSDNVMITRVVKIFLRFTATSWIMLAYWNLSGKTVASFRSQNYLSLFFYLMYLLLGFASLLWSTNPGYSMLQLLMTAESLIFTYFLVKYIVLYNQYSPEGKVRIYEMVKWSVLSIMVVFLIGKLVNPDTFFRLTRGGEEARLGGYLMNPNELGMLATVGLSMAMISFYKHGFTWMNFIVSLVLVYALFLTGSRSSLVAFMLVLFIFFNKSKYTNFKTVAYIVAFLSMPVMVNTLFIKHGDVNEVLSMTGRLPFWTALLTEGFPKEPYFGFGFMRIAYTEKFQSVNTYAGAMTHNTFIQVLMNLGLVGFTLIILQMLFTIKGAGKHQDKDVRITFTGILVPILINSFTEFGIYGENNYGILFWQLLIFMTMIKFYPHFNLYQKIRLKRLSVQWAK